MEIILFLRMSAVMVEKAEIYILDVGFGDAIFIKVYSLDNEVKTFLIDTGRKKHIENYNKFLKSEHVNCLIITHKHGDHMAYALEIIKEYNEYELDSVFMRLKDDEYGSLTNHKFCNDIKDFVKNENINLFDISDKKAFDVNLSAYGFSLLYPRRNDEIYIDNPNRNSIVLSLNINDNYVLFMGDATADEEKLIINREEKFEWNKVKIIKVGHHGSDTSSEEQLLKKIKNIEYGVLSVSKNKTHGLPNNNFLERWDNCVISMAKLLRTEDCKSKKCSTIKLTVTGNEINETFEVIS